MQHNIFWWMNPASGCRVWLDSDSERLLQRASYRATESECHRDHPMHDTVHVVAGIPLFDAFGPLVPHIKADITITFSTDCSNNVISRFRDPHRFPGLRGLRQPSVGIQVRAWISDAGVGTDKRLSVVAMPALALITLCRYDTIAAGAILYPCSVARHWRNGRHDPGLYRCALADSGPNICRC